MAGGFLDFKQLHYFAETVQCGTMSAAAKRCKVSQPAMSLAINELEKRLGEQLLTRGRRGVVPTDAGRILLHHTDRLLAEESQLRENFEKRSELQQSSVTFGMIPTIAPYLLPLLLTEFRNRLPSVEAVVVENRTPELIKRIAEGDIELAILSDVTKEDRETHGLTTKLLFDEPLMLAVPRRHEWAHRKEDPKPSELRSHDLIHLSDGHCLRDQTLQACKLSQAKEGLQCDQLETALAMVANNLGMAVIPKLAVRNTLPEQVIVRSFQKPVPSRKIYLLKKKDSTLSEAANEIASILVSDDWQG